MTIVIRSNHFVIFEAMGSEIGLINHGKLANFIRFYNLAKGLLNLAQAGGSLENNPPEQIKIELLAVEQIVNQLLDLGDTIKSKSTLKHMIP